jgi:hypothetical protein
MAGLAAVRGTKENLLMREAASAASFFAVWAILPEVYEPLENNRVITKGTVIPTFVGIHPAAQMDSRVGWNDNFITELIFELL